MTMVLGWEELFSSLHKNDFTLCFYFGLTSPLKENNGSKQTRFGGVYECSDATK